MLKCQLHTHVAGDLLDYIPHTAKDLIDESAKLGYEVLSITCHRKVIFNKDLEKYAKEKGILLLPGIEFEINKKHILGINIDKEIEKIDSFEKLREYRKSHPNCLIIAPHPFFPGKTTLKKELIKNIDLFDAIEHSFCYTTTKNYNKKAIKLAKKWKKLVVATSDCHFLKDLDLGYTLVDINKTRIKGHAPSAKSIVEAIKQNKIENKTKPTSYFRIFGFFIGQGLRNLFKK